MTRISIAKTGSSRPTGVAWGQGGLKSFARYVVCSPLEAADLCRVHRAKSEVLQFTSRYTRPPDLYPGSGSIVKASVIVKVAPRS